MVGRTILGAAALLLALFAAAPAAASGDKARAALEAYLATVPGAQAGRIVALTEDAVVRALPGQHLYAVRFRGYPVKPPDSFKNSNLFAVAADGPVKPLADEKALKDFFRTSLPAVASDADAKAALWAWLRLAEELHQDGYYTFEPVEDSVTINSQGDKRVVSGKVRVAQGGEGQISATLTFDRDGKLVGESTAADVKAGGARPAGARP